MWQRRSSRQESVFSCCSLGLLRLNCLFVGTLWLILPPLCNSKSDMKVKGSSRSVSMHAWARYVFTRVSHVWVHAGMFLCQWSQRKCSVLVLACQRAQSSVGSAVNQTLIRLLERRRLDRKEIQNERIWGNSGAFTQVDTARIGSHPPVDRRDFSSLPTFAKSHGNCSKKSDNERLHELKWSN